ncbi:MAG: hypothetical protein JNK48_22985 [Bryobacterales bacterium]|nr:hypothetical protein [Bryobacterales bacterium]
MTEAQRFFECFLRNGQAPRDLLEAYTAARAALRLPPDPLTERLVATRSDLSAAEFVRRRSDPRNGLTTRALLMLSLAEARPDCVEAFLLESPSVWRAWQALAAAPFLTAYRMVKGKLLLWWHGRKL